jgi:hypothetical protein
MQSLLKKAHAAAKKPRLKDPFYDADTKIASHDTTAVSLPDVAAADDDDQADVDPVKNNRATRHFTPEEGRHKADKCNYAYLPEKLRQELWYRKDWGAIAELVPGIQRSFSVVPTVVDGSMSWIPTIFLLPLHCITKCCV